MMKKVLIILNSNYHSEVALSLYGLLKINNYNPYIYITEDPYNLKDVCVKYNLNYIDKYDESFKDQFEKAFLITPTKSDRAKINQDINSIPNFHNRIIEDFKHKMILIIHKPSNIQYMREIISYFSNCKTIGLSPMASKFGINYLLPVDNILADLLQKKTTINDNKVKFLLMGRFCYSNRDLEPIAFLEKLKLNLNKEYEITIMGSHAEDIMPFFKKNKFPKSIVLKTDLAEIDFYNEINQTDFILNLLSRKQANNEYHYDVISSNYNHIFSFKKPQICFYPYNLMHPVPSITYMNENILDFSSKIEEAVNMEDDTYQSLINNFNIPILNARNHNARMLKDLI